jgi:hypothetical protein
MAIATDSDIRQQLRGATIGGGEGYRPDLHPADADREVSTRSALLSALSSSARIIAIADDADINMTGANMTNVGNKTLVSYRGWDGRNGGLIYTNTAGYVGSRPASIFYADGASNSPEFHNLRIAGSHRNNRNWLPTGSSNYNRNLSRAIMLRGPGGRVSNCAIWGFPWCQVHLKGRGTRLTRAEVDHCMFWRGKQIGYGYGVSIWYAMGRLHHNYYNEFRGAVNGQGKDKTGYVVEDEIHGPEHYRHQYDMHCLTENSQGSSTVSRTHPNYGLRAGGHMEIRRCQFATDRNNRGGRMNAIAIRGEPGEGIWIEDNRFYHAARPTSNTANRQTGNAYRQINVNGVGSWPNLAPNGQFTSNFHIGNNEYGIRSLDLSAYQGQGTGSSSSQSSRLPRQRGFPRERGEALVTALTAGGTDAN